MAVGIPANYPGGCSDEELQHTIEALSQAVVQSGANINTVLQLVPLVQAGQNEPQHRIVKRTTEQSAQTSDRALLLSKISLVVGGLVVAAVAAYFVNASSARWEAKQLPVLESIRDEVAAQRREARDELRAIGEHLERLRVVATPRGSGTTPAPSRTKAPRAGAAAR